MLEDLASWLERAAGFPDAGLRFVDRRERERWMPWSEVLRRGRETAGRLAAAGVRPGERVALVHPTGPEFFDSFFGVLLAGAVPSPLYPPVRLGRLREYHESTARMLDVAGARLVLLDSRVRRLFGGVLERYRPPLGARTTNELPERGGAELPARDPEDLALVQFSSGTTLEPKPVALTHRALCAQARILNSYWPDRDGQCHSGVSWLPLYHDMGLIGCVLPALERPGVLTLLGPETFVARPAAWLRAVSRYRATISPAPNFAYALATERVRDEDMEGVDLSSWQVALNGAETIVPRVLEAFCRRFARWGFRREALTPVYGLSEAALAVTFSRLHEPYETATFDPEALSSGGRAVPAASGVELVCLGAPLPGFEIEVRDGNGTPLEDGRVGSLWIRGPSLMEGYLGRPDETARVLRDGWLDTGDLGFVHLGRLFLKGRSKDILKLRGRTFAPDGIERAVHGLEGARPGRVVAVSRSTAAGTEELVLFVETRRGVAEGVRATLAERCRRAVLAATGLAPDLTVILDPGTLPRTSSGKNRRREALRRWERGELAPPSKLTPLRLAGEMLRSRRALGRMREKPADG